MVRAQYQHQNVPAHWPHDAWQGARKQWLPKAEELIGVTLGWKLSMPLGWCPCRGEGGVEVEQLWPEFLYGVMTSCQPVAFPAAKSCLGWELMAVSHCPPPPGRERWDPGCPSPRAREALETFWSVCVRETPFMIPKQRRKNWVGMSIQSGG